MKQEHLTGAEIVSYFFHELAQPERADEHFAECAACREKILALAIAAEVDQRRRRQGER